MSRPITSLALAAALVAAALAAGCTDPGAAASSTETSAAPSLEATASSTVAPVPETTEAAAPDDRRALTVVVGDRELEVVCTGEEDDARPLVVLEAGLGDGTSVWSATQDELGPVAACAYGRAGIGASDRRATGTVTMADWVADLLAVLDALSPDRPVLLVGHSIGAPIVRSLASDHPDRVAGLLLVDGTTDELIRETTRELTEGGTTVDVDSIAAANERSGELGDLPLVLYPTGATGTSWFDGQVAIAGSSTRSLLVLSDSQEHHLHRVRPTSVARLIQVLLDVTGGGELPTCEEAVAGSADRCPEDA